MGYPIDVVDEKEKCRKLKEGLWGLVKTVITTSSYLKFGKLVEATMRVKDNLIKV